MPPEMYWSLPLQSECFRPCSRGRDRDLLQRPDHSDNEG